MDTHLQLSPGSPQIVGYIRRAAFEQDAADQLIALQQAGCETLCWETSADSGPNPPAALRQLIQTLQAGDTLVVTRLDRLAVSVKGLTSILALLDGRGIILRATEQAIDTGTDRGRIFLVMLELFAEFESSIRKERQLSGVARAKANGTYKGRKPRINASRVIALHRNGKPTDVIAHELKIARSSVYRLLRQTRSR
jgi:DNA invertase Pin-like site-specific DNA recombinase